VLPFVVHLAASILIVLNATVTTDRRQQLEQLGHRLQERGYRLRSLSFFADNGIFVYTPPTGTGDIRVIERTVFLYWADAWEPRVTMHGGRHWSKRAATIEELESVALEALTTNERPPASDWIETTPPDSNE
jgi:hypothetical protein